MSRSFQLVYELIHSFEYDNLHYLLTVLSIGFLVLNNVLMDLLSVVPSIW